MNTNLIIYIWLSFYFCPNTYHSIIRCKKNSSCCSYFTFSTIHHTVYNISIGGMTVYGKLTCFS